MKLKAYIQLIRPYGIFIALMPLIGAIANGTFHDLLLLLLIGIFANSFGFVQNDYFDIEIDKKSGYVADRPLASGIISKKEAINLMAFLFLIPSLLAILFLSYYSFLFLMLYFAFYTLYNKFSKEFAFMEYCLGLAGMMIFLSGSFSHAKNISLSCLLLSILPILKYAFNVGISANLKDLEYDLQQGVKTTPAIFGVKVENGIHIPKNFILYGYLLKLIFIIISFMVFLFNPSIFSFLLLIIISFLLFYTMNKIFENIRDRKTMLFYAEIHEIATYMLIVSILYDYIAYHYNAFLSFALLILPPVWILVCIKLFFAGKPLE